MSALIAWRMLIHEKQRSVLAIGGILMAIFLLFLQIGLYSAIPRGALLFYNVMNFDLMLASSAYVSEAQPLNLPRRRLYQALEVPGVARAMPVYHGSGRWLNSEQGFARDVFVIGYNPDDPVFVLPELTRDTDMLRQQDVLLIDDSSRPEFGPLETGRRVEVEQRAVTIAGRYHLGNGFVGLGVAVTSDLNFVRMFPSQGGLEAVSLGLLTLKPGIEAEDAATRIRELLPPDTQVFTRKSLDAHEMAHWATNTSTGIIFGFGVVVAIVVGTVILNQTLSTQISRQLPQYATLKAIGYTDLQLGRIVMSTATILSSLGYVPAVMVSIAVYWIIRSKTPLPIEMTIGRLVTVLALAWGMSALSALLALRILRRADPAELF